MQLIVGSEADEDVVDVEYLSSQAVEEDDRSRWYYALQPGVSQQDACGGGVLVGCRRQWMAAEGQVSYIFWVASEYSFK